MLGNQITFWSNVRLDQIAFEVVYEKRKNTFFVKRSWYHVKRGEERKREQGRGGTSTPLKYMCYLTKVSSLSSHSFVYLRIYKWPYTAMFYEWFCQIYYILYSSLYSVQHNNLISANPFPFEIWANVRWNQVSFNIIRACILLVSFWGWRRA